jgi:hypothetical protein
VETEDKERGWRASGSLREKDAREDNEIEEAKDLTCREPGRELQSLLESGLVDEKVDRGAKGRERRDEDVARHGRRPGVRDGERKEHQEGLRLRTA